MYVCMDSFIHVHVHVYIMHTRGYHMNIVTIQSWAMYELLYTHVYTTEVVPGESESDAGSILLPTTTRDLEYQTKLCTYRIAPFH